MCVCVCVYVCIHTHTYTEQGFAENSELNVSLVLKAFLVYI